MAWMPFLRGSDAAILVLHAFGVDRRDWYSFRQMEKVRAALASSHIATEARDDNCVAHYPIRSAMPFDSQSDEEATLMFIVEGKPYGLSESQIQTLLDNGIADFDTAIHRACYDELEILFPNSTEVIEVWEAIQTYFFKHIRPDMQERYVHLLEDEPGFTPEMLAVLHSHGVYTIRQIGKAAENLPIWFPGETCIPVMEAVLNAQEEYFKHVRVEETEDPSAAISRANLGYRHAQYGPFPN